MLTINMFLTHPPTPPQKNVLRCWYVAIVGSMFCTFLRSALRTKNTVTWLGNFRVRSLHWGNRRAHRQLGAGSPWGWRQRQLWCRFSTWNNSPWCRIMNQWIQGQLINFLLTNSLHSTQELSEVSFLHGNLCFLMRTLLMNAIFFTQSFQIAQWQGSSRSSVRKTRACF